MGEKTYWIGDDRDNKSVCIGSEIFVRGDVIPIEDVSQERIDGWNEKGLISTSATSAHVIIKDTDKTKKLEAEIRTLKIKLDAMSALESQNKELKKSLEKAKDGAKAKRVKELEAELVKAEADNKEKAALIEKQAEKISDLETELEAATAPGGSS